MGTVYLAEDTTIGQQVAIKIIRTDTADISEASSPARARNALSRRPAHRQAGSPAHPAPYRYGEEQTNEGERAYMVMQFRPEGSLWDWLRSRSGLATTQAQTDLAHIVALF